MCRRPIIVVFFLLAFTQAGQAAALPEGFTERQVASGLTGATAMAFAPDGRLFVCQQNGQLRVIKNGSLLPTPFLTVSVDATGERGLLGVAFAPDFANNGFVYVYYTVATSPRHNRVSRFRADGDVAAPNSETLIFRLDDLSGATVHNGGAMHFGADGKLYVAVGENAQPASAQSLESLFGKMLRINPDGSIPADNPFFNTATGDRRAVWATGLRNPFTFGFQPGTSRLFINDVGEADWEEINEGVAGANYGWPATEGPTSNPAFRAPVFAYEHGTGASVGCAITGGAFYNPTASQFPSSFVGKYFFADFCSGWIRTLDPATGSTGDFASGVPLPVDLKVGPEGSLYYLARGGDAIFQIIFTGTSAPSITSQPASQTVSAEQTAVFSVSASGGQPLFFRWQRNGADIEGADAATLTLPNVSIADNGAQVRCIVSNSFGSATSDAAVLHVTTNQPPTGAILSPTQNSLYSGGDRFSYSGTAQDAEDGELAPAAFAWRVDFHHDAHAHPFLPTTTGSRSGSFNIPTEGEKSSNVWYRIHLKVTDSGGLAHESFRDVLPRTARVTLATEPAGLQLSLDGVPIAAPTSFVGVAGIKRRIATVQTQSLGGATFQFQGWSDGGAIEHDIATPANDTTLTAVFASTNDAPGSVQFGAASFNASEADGHVSVSVTRGGDTSGALSVDYATSDGTATERSDYLPALGSLRFAPGETSKTIRVLLTGGASVEGAETFTISLSRVGSPFALGSPSVATISVDDDDAVPPSTNPVDEAEFFVRQQYQDFLNREADADGLQFWTNEILGCGADAECVTLKRDNVSAAFFLSIEFQETGYLVYRMSVASFARFPRFREFLRDTQAMGRGVIVGPGDWQRRLEENQRAFIAEFVARPEFVAAFPTNLVPSEFVDRLNANTGASLSQAERDALVGGLSTGALDRAAVLREVTRDGDFVQRETNRAFVLLQYFGYLRRNPDDAPNDDMSGYDFWLNKLNQFNGNFIRAEMVRAFITSVEYRERFGP
ncbi:MAG TPA: PQQ-dependent sugar dehydrogenase [Pyrinomonadaceae bacterium]|nr:PQQ-dependent sugar dehydrogenase [Pyrinomonadaceae bacterium]